MDRPLSKSTKATNRLRLITKSGAVLVITILLMLGLQWIFTPSISFSKIRTAQVNLGTVTATISAGGVVVPYAVETISSEFDSQVLKVLLQPGAKVKKGDLIMLLNPQSVELEIASIREELALKDSQIETKKLQLTELLNDINSRYELLLVDLESRETRASRLKQLSGIGAFSKHELLESKLDVKRTKIEIRQLEQAIVDLKSKTDAELTGLNLEKSILAKSLAELQRKLVLSEVRASRDGVLSWLKNEEGASVAVREPLARVSDVSRYRIEATLSDFYASQLLPGMKAEIYYNDLKIAGRLSALSPTMENGVMKILIELQNSNEQLLKNNLRVDVGLVTKTVEDALSLSKGPYISGRGIQQVFVIRGNIAYKTEIEVGISNANFYQIKQGLSVGEKIIISDMSDYLHLDQITIN